jgi:hypothetical protein
MEEQLARLNVLGLAVFSRVRRFSRFFPIRLGTPQHCSFARIEPQSCHDRGGALVSALLWNEFP